MCTSHSIQRAMERTRYHGKSAVRFIENGIARGKSAEDFRQRESLYLANCGRDGCTAKAYNGYCLIISGTGECVTLYRLPEWFGKKNRNSGKKPVRGTERCGFFDYEM